MKHELHREGADYRCAYCDKVFSTRATKSECLQAIYLKGRDARGHLCSVTYAPFAIDHIILEGAHAYIFTQAARAYGPPLKADLQITLSDFRRIRSLLRKQVVVL